MIFHNLEAIFLHIGKTAGVSVEKMLCDEARDYRVADRNILFGLDPTEEIHLQHATAETVRRLVGSRVFDQYYKFTVVRNPFARMVSVYFYLYDYHQREYGCFERFIEQLAEIIQLKNKRRGSHYIPQVWHTQIDGKNVCDCIVHFEHLPQSLDPVRARLKITSKLEKTNAFRHPKRGTLPVDEFFTSHGIQLVQDLYAEDFATFGYSPDPASQSPILLAR